MNYSLGHDNDVGICITRVWGENKCPDDLMEIQKVARDYKAESGCSKYLFDMREATIIGDAI